MTEPKFAFEQTGIFMLRNLKEFIKVLALRLTVLSTTQTKEEEPHNSTSKPTLKVHLFYSATTRML